MIWLDEIEQENKKDREIIEKEINRYYPEELDEELMARVLRELVKELKSQYVFIDAAYDDLPDKKYDAEATLGIAVESRGRPLSDDAKELLG